MTVVYLDEVFLLNGIIDYLLLLCAARLAGEPLRRPRMALAAALGGLYAAAVFLPEWAFLGHPACKLAAADTGFSKNELYQMALDAGL